MSARRQLLHSVIASVLLGSAVVACSPDSRGPDSQGADPRVIDLYVADQKVPCTAGVSRTTCLQVRRDPNGPLEIFYDSIKGFDFEPGYRYHVRVEVTPVQDPPADASSSSYRLVELVEKKRST